MRLYLNAQVEHYSKFQCSSLCSLVSCSCYLACLAPRSPAAHQPIRVWLKVFSQLLFALFEACVGPESTSALVQPVHELFSEKVIDLTLGIMSMKILMSLLVCASMALTKAAKTRDTQVSLCPANWTPYNDRCYYCNSTQTTWDDAESCCQSQNGHLAFVGSVEEYDAIQQLVRSAIGAHPIWLGGSFSITVGKWISVYLGLDVSLLSPAQLTCSAAQCCLVMDFGDKKLGALACSNKVAFVCEKGRLQP
ncbi:hypothetical protein Q5P01_000968 [Channa striata]|uniref:C-type lectin domain-containing protein n=1 Tax=Channa striata TaxID=64152 RepID=A0AA88ICS2_CHASR|nr:hypothetical protein Q5P01_000968 [Channa striata]